jgi:cobalamin biosynthesis Mg chelatase CobN
MLTSAGVSRQLQLAHTEYTKSLKTSRAPRVSRVYKDESEETSSLVDVDTPHVASVESSFLSQDVKTATQAERREREEESSVSQAAEQSRKDAKAQDQARKESRASNLCRNSDNPVVLGNALLVTLLGAGLGVGAIRKHLDGQLSWGVVGAWSGAVGALGVADYFLSRFVLTAVLLGDDMLTAQVALPE